MTDNADYMTIVYPFELIKRWKIFPCNDDKTPRCKSWTQDATDDPAQITAWIDRLHPTKWGIPMAINGAFAVDIDMPDGEVTWNEWISKHGSAGAGISQITPSRGTHLIYAMPPDVHVPNSVKTLGKGIDLRSTGYVATGRGYRWQDGFDYNGELKQAPEWLLDKIRALTKEPDLNMRIATTPVIDPSTAGEAWLKYYLDKAAPGQRNDMGIKLALQLRDAGLSKGQAADIMRQYAGRVPRVKDDPYTEHEAMTSLNEAYSRAPRPAAIPPGTRREAPMSNQETINTISVLNIEAPPPEKITYVRGNIMADDGNCKRLISLHGNDFRFIDDWYFWDGRHWGRDENLEIWRRAKLTARSIWEEAANAGDQEMAKKLSAWALKSHNQPQLKRMIDLAVSEMGVKVPVSEFDRNPYLLNFLNGTLNLTTGELIPHNPEDYITKIIPMDYDPSATCPRWLQFLDEITDGDKELIDYLQRAIGYTLTGATEEQVFFICYGTGANGKSVFLETLLRLLGSDYATNAKVNSILTKDRQASGRAADPDIARLRGMRLVEVNEIPGNGRLDEAKIKELTGGDTITARHLYKGEITFVPEFKLWIRTNVKPDIREVDEGMWRRVQMIPFNVTIQKEKRDTKLQEKLQTEWMGIVNWAVMGSLAWQETGLKPPKVIEDAVKEYKKEQDIMAPFIDDHCVADPEATTKLADLYAAFKTWADTNGEKNIMTSNKFSRELVARGFQKIRISAGNTFCGIRLNNEK